MQHSNIDRPGGNKPISIDVRGEPLGVVLPEANGFRFLAVRFNAFAIDGRVFSSVEEARRAAGRVVAGEK